MKRTTVLATVLAALTMSVGVGAYRQQQGGGQDRVVEVDKLKDNLFVLRGGGGNTAVFVRSDGVTVIDTKLPGWGKPILDKIKELTDKPVTMIVNTHTHGDHVSGNVEFPDGVAVVTHENTKANMDKMMSPPGMGPATPPKPTIFQASDGRGLPTQTFKDRLSLGSGADQIELFYFGRAHTNGDAIVVFPSLRVMHMGDMFPNKGLPIMDSNNGGSAVEYAATLKKVHAGVPDVDSIITGHGPVMTPKDLLEYSEFVADFVSSVQTAAKAGQTPEQIAKSWTMPAKYAGYAAPQEARLRVSAELVIAESKEK